MDEDDLSSNMYPSDDDDNFFNDDDEMADGSEEEVEETQGASQYDDDVDVMGDSFAPDPEEKKKPYEVEFTCKRPEQIIEAQQKEIDHVASMFVIKVSSCSGRSTPHSFVLTRSLYTSPNRTQTLPFCCDTLAGTRKSSLSDTWSRQTQSP